MATHSSILAKSQTQRSNILFHFHMCVFSCSFYSSIFSPLLLQSQTSQEECLSSSICIFHVSISSPFSPQQKAVWLAVFASLFAQPLLRVPVTPGAKPSRDASVFISLASWQHKCCSPPICLVSPYSPSGLCLSKISSRSSFLPSASSVLRGTCLLVMSSMTIHIQMISFIYSQPRSLL